jgi:hypothetical protein
VVSFRGAISSMREQAAAAAPPRLVRCAARLCPGGDGAPLLASARVAARLHAPEEEIAYGPAAWLWDYLRRSGARRSAAALPGSGMHCRLRGCLHCWLAGWLAVGLPAALGCAPAGRGGSAQPGGVVVVVERGGRWRAGGGAVCCCDHMGCKCAGRTG